MHLHTVEHPLAWDSVKFAMVHSNEEIYGQKEAFAAHGCKWIH